AVWFDYRGVRPSIYAARIDTGGNVVDATGIPVANGVGNTNPTISAAGQGFIVTWGVSYVDTYQGPGVYAVRLDAPAQPLDATPITIAPNQSNVYQTSAASDGANWFVTWEQYTGGTTGYDVYGALVPTAGAATPTQFDVAKTTDPEEQPYVT